MSLTHIPLADLDEGLIAVLDVDAVRALAAGGVVDVLPQDPPYPIVRVTTRGKPFGPIAGHSHWECDVEIDIYSTYAGAQQCLRIANVISGILNMQPLALDGWTAQIVSLLDCYEVPDEFVNGVQVKRWTLPFLVILTAN